jgi:ABC-type multidrug transport system fused ATPase/permease subunit
MNTIPAALTEVATGDALQNPINPFYDLYKYYIDLVVRFNIYYFAILGALVSYLATSDNWLRIQPLLLLPLVLSIAQIFTYLRSLKLAQEVYAEKVSYLFKINSQNQVKKENKVDSSNETDSANNTIGDNKIKSNNKERHMFNPLYSILANFAIIHTLLAVGLIIAILAIPGPLPIQPVLRLLAFIQKLCPR